MPEIHRWFAFAVVAFGLVVTPGPNMLYLVSRSISQGRKAGLISLLGVALGFIVYMLLAAFGITALLMTVPLAYDSLRIGGALYLLYLAYQAVKPGGRSPLQLRELPINSTKQLVVMGFLTNLLNPKAAVLYLSLLPQFISPERGHILGQSLILGFTQIVISLSINGIIAMTAGTIAGFLVGRPMWITIQRWLMGTVLAALAVRMVTDARR